MNKIKVLEVIRQGQIGGGESHLLNLVHFMDKNRYEPICLSFTDGEMIRRLKEWGIKCHVIESEKPFDLRVQRKVGQIIEKEKIQIVHAHGSRAASNILYPSKRLRLPIIYTVHGWSFHDDQSKTIRYLRAQSEKLICRLVQQVICVSESNAETGKQTCNLKSPIIIENGINMEQFNPNGSYPDLRTEFGFDPNDIIIGFIARNTIQKAPLIYLEAIRNAHQRNKHIKALFVAEGELDSETDKFISDNNMNDYVYHSKFRTDVPAVLHNIDIYTLPSLWEGLSIALLEAMAMQKAIIATPTDGTKELLVQEQNGIIIPFNDPMALADAILSFVDNQPLKMRCEKNAHLLVYERFNAQRVAEAVQMIYSKLAR